MYMKKSWRHKWRHKLGHT